MTLFEMCKQQLEIMRQNKATIQEMYDKAGKWCDERKTIRQDLLDLLDNIRDTNNAN